MPAGGRPGDAHGDVGAPATRANLATLAERGATVGRSGEGALAAGDEGVGRMAEPEAIADAVRAAVGAADATVISMATRSWSRPARRTSRSTPCGSWGIVPRARWAYAVAAEAARRGAAVTPDRGPVALGPPDGVDVVRVETAAEMRTRCWALFPATDAVVMAAAVADFRPDAAAGEDQEAARPAGAPRSSPRWTSWRRSASGARARSLVGFAAETADLDGGRGGASWRTRASTCWW